MVGTQNLVLCAFAPFTPCLHVRGCGDTKTICHSQPSCQRWWGHLNPSAPSCWGKGWAQRLGAKAGHKGWVQRWWFYMMMGHLNTTCCNRTHFNFLHSVVGIHKPNSVCFCTLNSQRLGTSTAALDASTGPVVLDASTTALELERVHSHLMSLSLFFSIGMGACRSRTWRETSWSWRWTKRRYKTKEN